MQKYENMKNHGDKKVELFNESIQIVLQISNGQKVIYIRKHLKRFKWTTGI